MEEIIMDLPQMRTVEKGKMHELEAILSQMIWDKGKKIRKEKIIFLLNLKNWEDFTREIKENEDIINKYFLKKGEIHILKEGIKWTEKQP